MTDKTPSSQWKCPDCGLQSDAHICPGTTPPVKEPKENFDEMVDRVVKKHKPLLDALGEETPTVKGEYTIAPRGRWSCCNSPAAHYHDCKKDGEWEWAVSPEESKSLHSRDAKKCTCPPTRTGMYHEKDCPAGDGAKKDCTCAVNTNGEGKDFRGKKIICPAHPQDSLDVLQEILTNFMVSTGMYSAEEWPREKRQTIQEIQGWHITQVRELQQELKSLDLKWESTGGQKRNLQPFFNSHIDQVFDRALERLEEDR